MMGFDLETKRDCPHCGKQIGGGRGNLKTHIKKCKAKLGIVDEPETLKVIEGDSMSTFVEVNSVEKGCPVIINLDHIVEIVPWAQGGTALFISDSTVTGGRTQLRVSDNYDLFRQFALQTVSSEDIEKRIAAIKKAAG
jgi:hypothetical protein